MTFSKEVQEQVKLLFSNDKEFMYSLLKGDSNSIRTLGMNNDILPEEVIDAYKNNSQDELYEKAKFKLRKKQLYFKMIEEYANMDRESRIKK